MTNYDGKDNNEADYRIKNNKIATNKSFKYKKTIIEIRETCNCRYKWVWIRECCSPVKMPL